jgi:uncharacterized BrkB/YihY/UPF0761 family membrane protein
MRARPGFLPRLARALLLLATLFVGVGVTTALTALISATGTGISGPLGLVAAVVLNVVFYWIGLRILTPATIETSQLRPAAIVGGIAWTALQWFGSYLVVRQLRHTTELYGFFAIVLGLAFWLYLASRCTRPRPRWSRRGTCGPAASCHPR